MNAIRKPLVSAAICLACLGAAYAPALGRQTQAEMNIQADKDYKKADADLNAAYGKLAKLVTGKPKARLKAAQVAWIKFRDADSAFAASQYEGGTMQPLVYAMHLTQLTEQRAKQLKDAYKELKEK